MKGIYRESRKSTFWYCAKSENQADIKWLRELLYAETFKRNLGKKYLY